MASEPAIRYQDDAQSIAEIGKLLTGS